MRKQTTFSHAGEMTIELNVVALNYGATVADPKDQSVRN
jgi:hypothetical protein